MKKIVVCKIFLVMLVFATGSYSSAATVAEASTGSTHQTHQMIGTYDVADMSKEEQKWFSTFLKGNFFSDGWEQISSDILSNTVEHERQLMQIKLYELGFKIGSEWCKENDSRKINTSMLKKWGKELRNTANDHPHLLTEVILDIHQEVDEILN